MKNLIKELAKREGKKSQVKVGDLRETVSKLQDILAEECAAHASHVNYGTPFVDVYGKEFLPAMAKKVTKILKKKKMNYVCTKIIFDSYIDPLPGVVKAKPKKKK